MAGIMAAAAVVALIGLRAGRQGGTRHQDNSTRHRHKARARQAPHPMRQRDAPATLAVPSSDESPGRGRAHAHLSFTDIEGSDGAVPSDRGCLRGGPGRITTVRSGKPLPAHGGRERDTQGDAFFAVFSSPSACIAAAIEMQRAFISHLWPARRERVRVRMGVHSGEVSEYGAGLVGLEVHRAARVAAPSPRGVGSCSRPLRLPSSADSMPAWTPLCGNFSAPTG